MLWNRSSYHHSNMDEVGKDDTFSPCNKGNTTSDIEKDNVSFNVQLNKNGHINDTAKHVLQNSNHSCAINPVYDNHTSKPYSPHHPDNTSYVEANHLSLEYSNYQLPPFSDSLTQFECDSIAHFRVNKKQKENRNKINSSISQTIICDGMERYFEENNSVILRLQSESHHFKNGDREILSIENNLNHDPGECHSMQQNGINTSSSAKELNGAPNIGSYNGYAEKTALDSDSSKDVMYLHNVQSDISSSATSFINENSSGVPVESNVDVFHNDHDVEDASVEMDFLEFDFQPRVGEVNENYFVDSDLGSESRASSPQPSTPDSANENEISSLRPSTPDISNVNEVVLDANLSPAFGSVCKDINTDLGHKYNNVKMENRFMENIISRNGLPQNITVKPAVQQLAVVQNSLNHHCPCSSNSNHHDMDVGFVKNGLKNHSYNIQTEEEMELEDLNLHSICNNIDKKMADKDDIFVSKEKNHSVVKEDVNKMGLTNCTERVMIWSEAKACDLQVSQVAASACGATSIINAMIALKVPFSKEEVMSTVKTRLRAENAPLSEYLMSRACAGATHIDLISTMDKLTDGQVYGRFFHLFPAKKIQLMDWIADWIKLGAVPIVTLNLQKDALQGEEIPDAWHHQMVFGIGPEGLYATNPFCCISASRLSKLVCSESVLLIKRSDVIKRWEGNGNDLTPILLHPDMRWMKKNVIGQVVNVLREAAALPSGGMKHNLTHHIAMPASYQSGITFFIRKDSKGYQNLLNIPELS